jgi:hypothetical protein
MAKNKLEHSCIPRSNDVLKLYLQVCHSRTLSVPVPSLIAAVTRENTPSR